MNIEVARSCTSLHIQNVYRQLYQLMRMEEFCQKCGSSLFFPLHALRVLGKQCGEFILTPLVQVEFYPLRKEVYLL